MRHGRFDALNTGIEVWATSQEGFERTLEWFEEFESICSRFIPDSELSALNRDPRHEVPISPVLADVFSRADEMRRATDGLVDPALGAAVTAWGYDRSFEQVTGLEKAPTVAPAEVGWEVHSGSLTRMPGTLMDLGGIGKGWACDVAVERGSAVVVSAGGDVRSAHAATLIPVVDPWGATVATVALGEGALATSSTTRRAWRVGDGLAHHVIDPRTLRPAETPVLSATVVSATAAEAEAGAKTVLILGDEGLAWADRQHWIRSALVVWRDGAVFATSGMELVA